MIEGLTNDIFGYTYYDLPRQTRYMLPVPLGFCPQALVVNRKWWDSLPESERKALEFVIAATDMHQYFEDEEQRILKWWDENPDTILVKMTPEARAEWEAALRQATDDLAGGRGPWALLEAVRPPDNPFTAWRICMPAPAGALARPSLCGGKGKNLRHNGNSHAGAKPAAGSNSGVWSSLRAFLSISRKSSAARFSIFPSTSCTTCLSG